MVGKRSIKKVEIADDNIVDLKTKDKNSSASPNFTVHKILDEAPIDSFPTPSFERPITAPKFETDQLQQRMESFAEKLEQAVIKVAPNEHSHANAQSQNPPKDLIKVKFDKFVQLVASRDFLAVLERNRHEDIIMSSNLLTDLAGAVEERSEKKTPVIFLVGLAIGVIITYLLINR